MLGGREKNSGKSKKSFIFKSFKSFCNCDLKIALRCAGSKIKLFATNLADRIQIRLDVLVHCLLDTKPFFYWNIENKKDMISAE